MPKCLIAYFSQGGSTALVADSIAAGLRSAGYQIDTCNIKNTVPPPLKGYDLFGIGLPTYYYRPPFNVLDYVQSLPKLTSLPVFVFVLSGGMKGDAGNNIRQILAHKGAKDAGYFSCLGADYYLGFLLEGYLLTTGHPTQEELSQAEDFGCRIAERTAKKEFISQPYDSALPLMMYRLQRLMTCRLFVRLLCSRLFSVKREKCNSCGVCMKVCPVGNIRADKTGKPVWGRNCTLCFYCDMKCPQEAIISPARSKLLFRPSHIYNLRRVLKDSAVSYARAIVKAGRIERIE